MKTKENGESNRRSFVRKLAGLAALGGVTALLSGQRLEKAGAEGETVVVGGEYTTATSRTLIQGTTSGVEHGVFEAISTATSGITWGLYGQSDSNIGSGVHGYATARSGENYGVRGQSDSTEGMAVLGFASATSGQTYGVVGAAQSPDGCAVWGQAQAYNGSNIGVRGESFSPDGIGVKGWTNTTTSGLNFGVFGQSDSLGGRGVHGYASNASGGTTGVYGKSDSIAGYGVYGWASNASGTNKGVCGLSSSVAGTGVYGLAGVAGAKPMVARGAASQTANLQEWQNNAGSALSAIDKDGKLGIGTSSPSFMLHIISGVTGPLTAASAPGAGPAPNSFICENLTPGNFKSQFTFRASGANKWSFGNDMGGIGQQNFFIWDEVGAQAVLFIDSSRRVGLGTTSPTEKLHVAGNVKAASFITGDILMANDYKVTEDEKDGVAFLNPDGDKIAVLDRQGNFHIKGKVMEDL